MDFSSEHPLLQVTQEEIFLVQNSYDLDAKKINDNINTVEEWCKKQDHLVEALPYLSKLFFFCCYCSNQCFLLRKF